MTLPFVDCPSCDILMATMLNEVPIMDGTLTLRLEDLEELELLLKAQCFLILLIFFFMPSHVLKQRSSGDRSFYN